MRLNGESDHRVGAGRRFVVSLSAPAGATRYASGTGAKMLRETFGF
jgi:hypothetical protein